MKTLILILITFGLNLCGCTADSLIYSNKPLEEIILLAKEQNRPFCIVLVDSNQNLSKDYISSLSEKYKDLTTKAIYNITNINNAENNWYIKWLCPTSVPLTCIFSPAGQLIDIIPGATRESFLYAKSAITQISISEFHWPNHFRMQKRKIIPILNDILIQKNYLSNGIYLSTEIDSLIKQLNYPYITYLKLTGDLMINDSIAAKITSNSLLDTETPYYLEVYKNEYLTAKKLIDPSFRIENEPTLRVDKQMISIGECLKGKMIPIKIKIHNDGSKILNILHIITSCSCVKNLNESRTLTVVPKDSMILSFDFSPDMEGEISRNILIVSNAINKPILNIQILANSKP